MTTTFHLVCHETKQALWIGQGHGGDFSTFYSAEEETMARLAAFLRATKGKPLVLVSEHEIEDTAIEGYAELESMTPEQIAATGPATA